MFYSVTESRTLKITLVFQRGGIIFSEYALFWLNDEPHYFSLRTCHQLQCVAYGSLMSTSFCGI